MDQGNHEHRVVKGLQLPHSGHPVVWGGLKDVRLSALEAMGEHEGLRADPPAILEAHEVDGLRAGTWVQEGSQGGGGGGIFVRRGTHKAFGGVRGVAEAAAVEG